MNVKSINDLAKDVLTVEANSILRLVERIGNNFDKAIEILYNCKGRVIVTGMGKSGLIGKKIAATLSSTGTPSYFLHPAESTHGDSGLITREDVGNSRIDESFAFNQKIRCSHGRHDG